LLQPHLLRVKHIIVKDPAAKAQAENFWKMLDDMADTDPEGIL
jgi:hypothetical protein